jgi:site-specific recombinase XerD
MAIQNAGALDALIEAYKQHQRRSRGLREKTLHSYERVARLLLRTALGDDPVDVTRLVPGDLVDFFAATSGRFSPRSMKTVRTALRSFLRFLRFEGLCDERLEAALPAVAHWRLSTLPRHLSDEELRRLLASFDVAAPYGSRDRAIVVCLATLGLRPQEVADLCLDDIDWRSGVLHLRTRKTRRGAALPLPHAVGRAVTAYLCKERPKTIERRVFVQLRGRRCGSALSSQAISAVVARALDRAGIHAPLAGAYVLRHTVASRMVRRGTSLKEVADFLGHRSLDTTTIYAKLDIPALREVALPWPEEVR